MTESKLQLIVRYSRTVFWLMLSVPVARTNKNFRLRDFRLSQYSPVRKFYYNHLCTLKYVKKLTLHPFIHVCVFLFSLIIWSCIIKDNRKNSLQINVNAWCKFYNTWNQLTCQEIRDMIQEKLHLFFCRIKAYEYVNEIKPIISLHFSVESTHQAA